MCESDAEGYGATMVRPRQFQVEYSAILIFAYSTISAGQTSPPSSERVQRPMIEQMRPPEREDDPYEPAASTPLEAPGVPSVAVERNGFTSVQVNVNGFGQNILRDAANEPSLAIDPNDPNRIVIGWRQFDSVNSNFRQAGRAYSRDGGRTWTNPGVLQPGQFRSDPVLDVDSTSTFYYYSLSSATSGQIFRSSDGGISWSGPFPARGGDKPWMTIARTGGPGDGFIYAMWSLAFSCCAGDFTRSSNRGVSFMIPVNLPFASCCGTLSVGPDGSVYASNAGISIARSSDAQDAAIISSFEWFRFVDLGGFLTGFIDGPNPGGLLGQVWVATDHSPGSTRGNVYMLASVSPYSSADPLDVMFVRSTDRGETWSAPQRLNDDPSDSGAWQWFGTMSVAPNGRIDAVWNDTRNSSDFRISELCFTYSIDAGRTWAPNVVVTPPFNSHVGWPRQNKLGDYYHMISDTGAANLAYAATFNNEQDIYFLRMEIDCNSNGIADIIDVAGGARGDCNQNQIPDECEPYADCNQNAIQDVCEFGGVGEYDCNQNWILDECEFDCNGNLRPDECDLADGTSSDCNVNAVPDECESNADCNDNGIQDICDIAFGLSPDCNFNEIPDACDIENQSSDDCNTNSVPDECDVGVECGPPIGMCPGQGDCCDPIGNGTPGCECAACCHAICEFDPFCCEFWWDAICAAEAAEVPLCQCAGPASEDCNGNAVPDECEPYEDCNRNGVQDLCDVVDTCGPPSGACPGEGSCCSLGGNGSPGCSCAACCLKVCESLPECCEVEWGDICVQQAIHVPECRCSNPISADCNANSVPDECEPWGDCNANTIRDICDIGSGASRDCDTNLVPDECQADADADGMIDPCDPCPEDPANDFDADGYCAPQDQCPADSSKIVPGECGCGIPDADQDGDSVPDCRDRCLTEDDTLDYDRNGIPDCVEPGPVPTASHWGLTVLTLAVLVLSRRIFRGRVGNVT